MPITPLPTPPLRSDGPTTFADRGDTFMAALPAFVTQANALEANVDALEASAVNQVSLAVNQVALATEQAVIATSNASISTSSAAFKGNWSTLTGALAMPASVAHDGSFWALNTPLANVTTATPGVSASWTQIKRGVDVFAYNNRAALRDLSPAANDQAIVDGLGYFVWEAASTEPDDDESCFATASGRWLLQAAHWDVVDAWQAPELEAINGTEFLHGTATCAITSVSNVTSASFTGDVTGASIGDRVIATPPAQLGQNASDTSRLSYHAWVSAVGTVTVMLTNASAAPATINPAIQTAWPITVIKS